MIGLSISFCISDILRGKVSITDVEKIVSGTKVVVPAQWDYLAKEYKKYYWQDDPVRGEQILRQLLAEGKIYQPRVHDGRCPVIDSGRWVGSELEINYRNE